MTVETFNPSATTPVKFTDKAIRHLQKQVINQSAEGIMFNVKESGCSGFKYLLELAFDVDGEALVYSLNEDLNLYVLPKIIELIRGTEVDYVQEGVNHRLDFKNPNATANCGCGESFSVEQQS
ncbi:MAG: iron-sulfur cluster assembly accessory protein [Kangiellaceae bacterium]|nr:iron-sulfur cluster assembly accessory protein [Kangiellaceae bacterium]